MLRTLCAAFFVGTIAQCSGKEEPLTVIVTPAAKGPQLVRLSLPFLKGHVGEREVLLASNGKHRIDTSLRPLTWHVVESNEVKSVRRGLVTFPYSFRSHEPVKFTFQPKPIKAGPTPVTYEPTPGPSREGNPLDGRRPNTAPLLGGVGGGSVESVRGKSAVGSRPVEIKVDDNTLNIAWRKGPALKLRLLAPARTNMTAPRLEIVESNAHFLWERYHYADPQWPRTIEIRSDALGGVVVVAHLQRNLPGDGRAPDFGWELQTTKPSSIRKNGDDRSLSGSISHNYTKGEPSLFHFDRGRYALYHPAAFLKWRGYSEGRLDESNRLVYRYWRCRVEDRVPMQSTAWQRAEIVIAPSALAPLRPTLESPHEVKLDWRNWDALYDTGPPLDLSQQPELTALVQEHYDNIIRSMAHGDDWGNVTSYVEGSATGAVLGMNRLNHGAPIFEEAYRSGNRRLLEIALLWCDNFYDQSIWWGAHQKGGTRYNNVIALKQTPPDNDETYMWRSNDSVSFCTKGFDAFFFAYEQTGDPRMLEALEAQVRYASERIHVDRGECRNIGDVRDFVRLYRFTGQQRYLDEALRLFRELRSKLSPDHLFDQGGKLVETDPSFIEEDEGGLRHGYAKPYIIGYALAGLPELGRYAPAEPGLRETVQAVADFLADSQDTIGGWRYPHPRSSYVILSQGIEHAWQLVQAARLLGVQEKHLDAIERVLRQRILGWQKTGKMFAGLTGWEIATGKVKDRTELYQLYRKPSDRDATRDYSEGHPEFGASPPEGLVYFPEVLAFYLKHRPASRLLAPAKADEPLSKVLERVEKR